MAYEIKIIGDNNPVMLDNDRGLQVKVAYDDDNVRDEFKIRIGDELSVRKGQIRYVRKVEESPASKNKVVESIGTDHLSRYRAIRDLPPRKKTEGQKALYRETFRSMNGRYPNDSEIGKYHDDAEEFFRENPKRTVPDSGIFMDNLPVGGGNIVQSKFMLRLLENVIIQDIETAKYHG